MGRAPPVMVLLVRADGLGSFSPALLLSLPKLHVRSWLGGVGMGGGFYRKWFQSFSQQRRKCPSSNNALSPTSPSSLLQSGLSVPIGSFWWKPSTLRLPSSLKQSQRLRSWTETETEKVKPPIPAARLQNKLRSSAVSLCGALKFEGFRSGQTNFIQHYQ